jgi:excisionase family DNA binding protein
MHDKWYTVSEAAGLLGVSTETIRRHIKSGKLEGKKEGNQYIIKPSSIGHLVPHNMPQVTAINVTQLEGDIRLLEERSKMLEQKVRELEEDKGFLLRQIAEKDQLIGKLTPLALPMPRRSLKDRFRGLFGKSTSSSP